MVTTTDTEGDIFKDNQTIRVIDQLANDDAVLFNTKYLGVVPNNAAGRTSLWSDLVKLRQQLQELGAIEDFADSDVSIAQGDTKKSVVVTNAITVVNAMDKLYMTVQQMTMLQSQRKQQRTRKNTSQSVMRSVKECQPLIHFKTVGLLMHSIQVLLGVMVWLMQ